MVVQAFSSSPAKASLMSQDRTLYPLAILSTKPRPTKVLPCVRCQSEALSPQRHRLRLRKSSTARQERD